MQKTTAGRVNRRFPRGQGSNDSFNIVSILYTDVPPATQQTLLLHCQQNLYSFVRKKYFRVLGHTQTDNTCVCECHLLLLLLMFLEQSVGLHHQITNQ